MITEKVAAKLKQVRLDLLGRLKAEGIILRSAQLQGE
jgi:hypothetical protein